MFVFLAAIFRSHPHNFEAMQTKQFNVSPFTPTSNPLTRNLLTLLITLFATGLFAQIRTPAPSPGATVSQAVGLAKVTVEYSRPAVKGRKIFGDLVAYGKVWRTGANKITTISFDQDVLLNGQKIKAGSYGWYTVPGENLWTVALNTDDKQWGAYAYDAAKDVIRLALKPEKTASQTERLTIEFDNVTSTSADVVLSWDKTAVRFRIDHEPHEQILAAIKTETAKSDANADTYFTAAEYYYDHNLDMKQALAWADKVLETDKNWWSYYLRASIEAKLGQCDKAVADATIALEGAEKDKDDSYIKKSKQILADCKKK
jgi:hypothetical protein